MHPDTPSEPKASPLLKLVRFVEFVALFFAIPVLYAYDLRSASRHGRLSMIVVLIGVAVICLIALLCDRSFSRRRLWNATDFAKRLTRVLVIFLIVGAGLTLAAALLRPNLFLGFVRRRPMIWGLVMVLYPLLSVYPQEVVYRAFLFHRYRALFPTPWVLLFVSAAAFGFMHIIFWNWVAVALSLGGGFLFAWTYQRTQSLLMAGLEHALYGCLIFTVGLGHYFFHGTIRLAERLGQ